MSKAGGGKSGADELPVSGPRTVPLTGPAAAVAIAEPFPVPSPQDVKKEANPFTDKDWRMWLYAWSGFALRLMLVFGAAFSVYQYSVSRQEKRIERTMELVALWEQADYQDAQKALNERLVALGQKYAPLITPKMTDQQKAVIFRKIGNEVLTEAAGPVADFEPKFEKVVYFLNRVGACVLSGLCERSIANDYFTDYATSFWSYFADYISRQRTAGSANYAQPLESFLNAEKAKRESAWPAWMTDLWDFWT